MARIRFKSMVISSQYGTCMPGEMIVCSDAFARHAVEDLGAAVYLETPPAAPAAPVTPAAPVKGRRRKE
jgi:hypothetical protein